MPSPEHTGDEARDIVLDPQHHDEKQERDFAQQAERLAQFSPAQEDDGAGSTQAIEAKFITPLDPVVETADGGRLPAIPVEEAVKLNALRNDVDGTEAPSSQPVGAIRPSKDGTAHGTCLPPSPAAPQGSEHQTDTPGAPLREAIPPSSTNPLFPPLPVYGPPTFMRTVQCWLFRMISSVLSLYFLLAIVAGAIVESVPRILKNATIRATFRDPKKRRPFYEEEKKRAQERKAADDAWLKQQQSKGTNTPSGEKGKSIPQDGEFVPTEGGPDPLVVDVGYYARRVGLDAESFDVQTEDGFIIELIHLFNPRDYRQPPPEGHKMDSPDVFTSQPRDSGFAEAQPFPDGQKKYPILMMHGLLQSAGAYCCTDDDSLAFYLAKSGYDVWLGNNRCGFDPKHTLLQYSDPRMWAWNIRQMGVMDLPALISRVLAETGFPKLALICHSQSTTQTFVALAKEQRPDIGEKISVFCALAPAAYAGSLIGKIYFKVMRLISPAIFRLIFGIHAFIPLMMLAHKILPGSFYSWMGYHVFSFLFSWSDTRWDRGLRNRMFQWAPTYVSAESMRWWLGRECFAKQKCILATREAGKLEDKEDEEDDEVISNYYAQRRQQEKGTSERRKLQRNLTSFHRTMSFHCQTLTHQHHDSTRGKYSWYNDQFPPLALWVCGADDLVDGKRLLRRFDRGREPHVRIVHKKIIEGYEHLDVIWAMDAIEKVGKEVREVIWRTVDPENQMACRTPVGCERPLMETPDITKDVPMLHSGGRLRMASISEGAPFPQVQMNGNGKVRREKVAAVGPEGDENQRPPSTVTAHSKEKPGEHSFLEEEEEEFGHGVPEKETEKASPPVSPGVPGRKMSEPVFTDLQEKGNPLG
ncbi:alpha/beta-hydrolase [Hortaea werneckii]|nr:alpha/beta-hydrolase [Hortaea werneckii]